MKTVTGIFTSRKAAERAMENLRSAHFPNDRMSLLMPGSSDKEVTDAVPTTETEQPGMGRALGGTVGAALGVAGGLELGAVVASILVPGVGPVIVAGLIGAALLGAGGAATGIAAGEAVEEGLASGLPHDELYVYEDALRKGRSVLMILAKDETEAATVRGIVSQAGAESVDAAREEWWIGLRDDEEARYVAGKQNFNVDEPVYRRGFEAALHSKTRGKSWEDSVDYMRDAYGNLCDEECFRRGFERGQVYDKALREKKST